MQKQDLMKKVEASHNKYYQVMENLRDAVMQCYNKGWKDVTANGLEVMC